jgi:hypothetical protein
MSNDISGFGLKIYINASVTFPTGFVVTQSADDADAFDQPSQQINETAMGVNGDQISWSKANPIKLTLSVVPGSEDDINLGILAEANRAARGKQSARDVITMTVAYPKDRNTIYSGGVITDASLSDSVASAGRLKSKTYGFSFENLVKN